VASLAGADDANARAAPRTADVEDDDEAIERRRVEVSIL
jgi:hypothetical protein